ncbi:site-specific DNA-methyltransferase [Burkholderia sp. MBR-1]|uniref:site-specific DNA-methyltransferase n=1 Tax=Burkholderia sp. MBR-1 TaxID=2732364 RepID=UPI0015EF1EEF|nr:site-specific DNA-methyltransferase [Burkholderia sp. MBR-1]QMI49971.1 site-specific DNA-methyltransferase [Burkholderia sp. MBR-1]
MLQLDLFAQIVGAYATAEDGRLATGALYEHVAAASGIPPAVRRERVAIGKAAALRSPFEQRVRWAQQALRAAGVLERVAGARGVWQLTEAAGRRLNRARPTVKLLAFSTDLGIGIWARSESVFPHLGEPIHLVVSSPPYPLAVSRAYGGTGDTSLYIDFILRNLEPLVASLAPGAMVALNLSNDHFLPGSPARSTYREELVLAICKHLHLYKVDEVIWENRSKSPAPAQWACVQRYQLLTGYEPIYIFTNDPHRMRADNRRVLEPHTERHSKLIDRGGEDRRTSYGDGAHQVRPGSYSRRTDGRIPKNVIHHGHACAETREHHRAAKRLGLPAHGAMMPIAVADFLVRWLSEPGDLVVDHCAGSGTTGKAAERNSRRWVLTEQILEYVRLSAEGFRTSPGFWLNPAFEPVRGSPQPR